MTQFYDVVDGGYLTWLYGSKPFARANWPPQSVRGALLALDCLDATFRVQRDPTYKANRIDKRHEDHNMWEQWKRIRELRREVVEDPRLNCVRVPGLEADDIIALAAWKFGKPGRPVSLLAQDKDLLQIQGVRIKDNQGETVDMARFANRLPKALTGQPLYREQLPVILALMGDKSDNVPRLVNRGDLWRMVAILHAKTVKLMYEAAVKEYGKAFLKNLYAVVLPEPYVLGFKQVDVFEALSTGRWGPELLKSLTPAYKAEVKKWRIVGLNGAPKRRIS